MMNTKTTMMTTMINGDDDEDCKNVCFKLDLFLCTVLWLFGLSTMWSWRKSISIALVIAVKFYKMMNLDDENHD